MGMGDNNFKSDSVEYSTPWEIFHPLQAEFTICFDICANKENSKCTNYYTKEDDCLTKDWNQLGGNIWMNPPWGREMQKFVRKAREESYKGKTIVCLLPVRSNTKWWHETIIDTKAEVRFLRGEIKFNGLPRGLWLPCAIVIFRPNDALSVKNSNAVDSVQKEKEE
jgi:site-specific DNA-methyltransferase (adenine-specific)